MFDYHVCTTDNGKRGIYLFRIVSDLPTMVKGLFDNCLFLLCYACVVRVRKVRYTTTLIPTLLYLYVCIDTVDYCFCGDGKNRNLFNKTLSKK